MIKQDRTNKITVNETLKTKNERLGFFGTINLYYQSSKQAEKSWTSAFITLMELSNLQPKVIRRFLDSKAGRHLADTCIDSKTTVAETIKKEWQKKYFKIEVFHKTYKIDDEKFYEE